MGVIKNQSIKSSISLYIGLAIGALNTVLIFPYVFNDQPEYWGLLQLLIAYSVVISTFSHLGVPQIYNRFFPAVKEKGQLLFFSLLLTFFGFSLMSIIILFWKDEILTIINASELLEEYFFYIFLLVFLMSFYNIYESISRSFLESSIPIFLNEVFLRLYTLVALVFYGIQWIDFNQFVILIITGYFFKLLIIFLRQYLKGQLIIELRLSSIQIKKMLKYGFFVITGTATATIVTKVDLFMIGALMDLEYVAFYSIAFFIGSVIKVPARSIGAISIPLLAKAWEEKKYSKIQDIYTKSSINQLILGGLLFLFIFLNIDSLLGLLPEKFSNGKQVVLYIGLAQLFNVATGVNGSIIINSKYYQYDIIFNTILLLLTIAMNYILIPTFGINGAAMATAIAIFIFYSIKTCFVFIKLNMHPFSRETFYTIILFVAIYYSISWIEWEINSYLSIIVKTTLIIFSFIPFLFCLNLSKELCDFLKAILRIKKIDK